MLPEIIKIYDKSDFTVQLPLAEGYAGQEFRFTLYTCGEPENGWVASYINGVYTNCSVEDDIVIIYVNNNNQMNPGCLTVQSEYDYFNSHFADNTDNVKDNYKTNIYLVNYRTNSFSAEFRPSNRPDLSGISDYVTFDDLEAMSYASTSYVADYVATHTGDIDLNDYVSKTELNQAAYVSQSQLSSNSYATQTYVADYVATHGGGGSMPDMSAYVTHNELNAASYISSIPSEYVTDTELNNMGYATQTYVADYVYTHGGGGGSMPDMSAYVTHEFLESQSYLQTIPDTYATKSYVAEYVSEHGGDVDLSSYVTKTDLNNAGYISSIPSEYITQDELSANAYLTQHQDLSSYAKKSDLSSYVTKTELNNASYITQSVLNNAGYISSIPSEYVTESELSAKGYITSIPSEYITQDELSSNAYLTQHQDLSSYAKKSDLSSYVTKTELNNAGYISSIPSEYITQDELSANAYLTQHQDLSSYATKSYVADYVATYAPTADLSAYVTHTELNAASYVTQTSLSSNSYVTRAVLNSMGYITNVALNQRLENASYASVVEITQYDYDMLSTSEKTNGSLYVIVDADDYEFGQYVTYAYLTDYVNSYGSSIDLSAYVTKSELNAAGYISSIPSEYITQDELSSNAYLTQHQDLSSYAKKSDLSSYVTKTDLNNAGYISSIPSEYITQDELSSNAYLTQHQDLSSYATKSYVADYVAEHAPTPDLSAYVTKTELNNAAYITAAYVDSKGYAKSYTLTQAEYDELVSGGTYDPTTIYIISDATPVDLSYYVLISYLESNYYSKSYVDSYFVSKAELEACGYLTYSNFQYDSTYNTLTIII